MCAGQPAFTVGGAPGRRGVVATSFYELRQDGVVERAAKAAS